MSNAAMVIMWLDSNDSVILSQRSAPGEEMPTVASNPPRVASLSSVLTNGSSSFPRFGYTISANSDTEQSIVWAFSSTHPASSAVDAPLQIHTGKGTLKLDLTKTITASNASAILNPVSLAASRSGTVNTATGPYTAQQRIAIAHGVFAGVSFLVFLPFGALLARFARTFTGRWFTAHWIVQFGITAPMVIIALALGISAVSVVGGKQLYSTHEKLGVAIIVLYAVQCALGGLIHFVKPTPRPGKVRTRPPQNYGHAVLGLLIIALSFYQVRTGYRNAWPAVGRGLAPASVNTAWIVWVIIIPLLYLVGLALLPRQYRLERAFALASQNITSQENKNDVPLTPLPPNSPMQEVYSPNAEASSEDITLRGGERSARYDGRRYSSSRPGSLGLSSHRLSSLGRTRDSGQLGASHVHFDSCSSCRTILASNYWRCTCPPEDLQLCHTPWSVAACVEGPSRFQSFNLHSHHSRTGLTSTTHKSISESLISFGNTFIQHLHYYFHIVHKCLMKLLQLLHHLITPSKVLTNQPLFLPLLRPVLSYPSGFISACPTAHLTGISIFLIIRPPQIVWGFLEIRLLHSP